MTRAAQRASVLPHSGLMDNGADAYDLAELLQLILRKELASLSLLDPLVEGSFVDGAEGHGQGGANDKGLGGVLWPLVQHRRPEFSPSPKYA